MGEKTEEIGLCSNSKLRLNILNCVGELAVHTDTNLNWEKWGESEPYFGVVSHDSFLAKNLSESKDAFFQTGQAHISRVLEDIQKRFGEPSRRSALDFGYGVGTLLVPLAALFETADALYYRSLIGSQVELPVPTMAQQGSQ